MSEIETLTQGLFTITLHIMLTKGKEAVRDNHD